MNMKRELLFKAKSIENGSWVEGSYYKKAEYLHCICTPKRLKSDGVSIQINEDTLCQYTGLMDINRKKIFESDILRGYDYPFQIKGKDAYYAKVVWFEDAPSFGIQVFKTPTSFANIAVEAYTDYMTDWNSQKWEVIDNEIDNRLNINYCSATSDFLVKYAILQLGIESRDMFRQYRSDSLQKPRADAYQLVHVDYARCIEGESIKDFLEKIYHRYDFNPPEKYKGRDMASGDIIAITDGRTVNYYYVNSFGFELIRNFHHDTTEVNLGVKKF